jgi:ATP-binding cassette, subfamily B, bacterial
VVEEGIASGPVTLVTSAVSVAVFAAAALVIRWDLALVAFAAAPAFWLLARGFSGPARRAADAERAASGSLASAVEESLANQALIQAFNRQDAESGRLHREGMSWLLGSRRPREQAADWSCVPSPLAEVPARSVLT